MASLRQHYLTPEEYLAIERGAESKSEYVDGVMYAMAGATERHNSIVANLIISIGVQIRGRDCRVYPSDLKVRVPNSTRFFYPDVSVICGKPIFADDHKDVVINPTVVIEVLSDSTAGFDRGKKFISYQQIDSIKEIVLIWPDDVLAENFVRQPDKPWLYSTAVGMDAVLDLASIECKVRLRDVYDLAP